MSDEPDPTPEELAAAQELQDFLDGKPGAKVPKSRQQTLELLQALQPPSAERLQKVKDRLVLRKKPRWRVRATIAAAIAASILITFVITRPQEPKPGPELLHAQQDALKTGDPQAVDLAMQAYRRELVNTELLRPAKAAYEKADAAIAKGDLPQAREVLSTLTSGGGVIGRDAWFRLATIELRAGKHDDAIADADRGLALGRPADVFTVNLYLARAAAHRAKGERAKESEDLHAALVLVEALASAALEGK